MSPDHVQTQRPLRYARPRRQHLIFNVFVAVTATLLGYAGFTSSVSAPAFGDVSAFATSVVASLQRNGDDLKLIMPGNITFASNSADISSGFYPTLNSLVLVFKEFDKNGVNIVGHTDSTGSLELNQSLSNRRAMSVANYLTANGVPGQRISSYGAGPSQPIASNANESGRAQNRRVEINLRPL